MSGARLSKIGDGKIFVSQLESVVSIRTGLQNEDPLQLAILLAEAAE